MSNEFKSFYKTVGGGEGDRCNYPTRLDTYGKGCQFDCKYCYAKTLLDFRKMWNHKKPAVASIEKIARKIPKIGDDVTVRMGGMCDCFMPQEEKHGVTYETIKLLNEHKKRYLIVTKSNLIATDKYLKVLDRDLCAIQVSITATDDSVTKQYENAPLISERIKAIETLQKEGFDVSIRVSPYIPEYVDNNIVNQIKCDKLLVEFLRVNHWVKKWFTDISYDKYTLKEGGYLHLPLDEKLRLLEGFTIPQKSICDDVDEHYEYFKENYNFNKEDCCNVSKKL